MSTSTDYMELRYFNNTNNRQDAILSNKRTFPFIKAGKAYTATVVRFDADNSNVPMFIPRIENPKVDLAYDENGQLRDIFKNSTNAQFLQKYNGTQNIQSGGQFDLFGDLIVFTSNLATTRVHVEEDFKRNTFNDGQYVGVWNHVTGVCNWVDHLAGLYIGFVDGFHGVFDSLMGCHFSSDGTKIYIVVLYDLYEHNVFGHKYLSYLTVDTQYGGSVETINITDDYLGSGVGDRRLYKIIDGLFLVADEHVWELYFNKNHVQSEVSQTYAISAIDMRKGTTNILCIGDKSGTCNIWVGNAGNTHYSIGGTFTIPNTAFGIESIVISPDGQHIVAVTGEYYPIRTQTISVYKINGTFVKAMDPPATGSIIRNITFKPKASISDTEFVLMISLMSGNQSFIKVYNFGINAIDTPLLFTVAESNLSWQASMTNDGKKMISSFLDPSTFYSDQSYFRQYDVDFINNGYDSNVARASQNTIKQVNC
jgi:hypothetical protein